MRGITDFKSTLIFHFHTQKLEPLCTALKKICITEKVLLSGFHLNGYTLRFHLQR